MAATAVHLVRGQEAGLSHIGQVDRTNITMAGATVLAAHHNHRIQIIRIVDDVFRIIRCHAVLATLLEASEHLLLVLCQRQEALGRGQVVRDAHGTDWLLAELLGVLMLSMTALVLLLARASLALRHGVSQTSAR